METLSVLRDLMRSSRMHLTESRRMIQEMEHTIDLTVSTVRRSQILLHDTDRTIDRWKTLGCTAAPSLTPADSL